MNVLALVTFKVFPAQMGGQKGVVHFYKHLMEYANVFMAVSEDNGAAPPDWNIEKVLSPNKKMFLNPFVFSKLKKTIKRNKIDVIIAEHSYAAWLALLLKKMFQIPFVIHSHNIEANRFRYMRRRWWPAYHYYEKKIHQQADYNFFISAEDEQYAINNFGLSIHKCSVITYGVDVPNPATHSKKAWLQANGSTGSELLFYFNGTLDYKPNYDAVNVLLYTIAPLLQERISNFRILVSGNRTPAELVEQMNAHPHFIFRHFVPDVAKLYQMADVFINPVVNNTGIKTKVVEALAANCSVVSTESGASGISKVVCEDKLLLAPDHHWQAFTDLIIQKAMEPKRDTPKAFFDTYLWNNIAQKAAYLIHEVAHEHAR